MKGLEALNKIAYVYGYDKNIKTVEKELKVLEIIKEKLSPLARATFYPMTKEEYDLLEEVLNG